MISWRDVYDVQKPSVVFTMDPFQLQTFQVFLYNFGESVAFINFNNTWSVTSTISKAWYVSADFGKNATFVSKFFPSEEARKSIQELFENSDRLNYEFNKQDPK